MTTHQTRLRALGVLGVAIVVAAVLFWRGGMQGTGGRPDSTEPERSLGVVWSQEFDAVSSLAAVDPGIVASVVIGTRPYLVGIAAEGRMRWREEVREPALVVAGTRWAFAAMENQITSIDPGDGRVLATREIDPPRGGWEEAATLGIGDDLLVADAKGIERLRGPDLEMRWRVTPTLDENSWSPDRIRQLVHEPPWIAAISKHRVTLISERGEVRWTRRLPEDMSQVSAYPLVLADGRVWVGLEKTSDPGVRALYALSVSDGAIETQTAIGDLAMYCPGHASSGVLLVETQDGLAGLDIEDGLSQRWSLGVRVVIGSCALHDEWLLVPTRDGELLRVAVADGWTETLVSMPRTLVWVPPAPHLKAGVHRESIGWIEHPAPLPGGAAFSVAWQRGGAAILFRPW